MLVVLVDDLARQRAVLENDFQAPATIPSPADLHIDLPVYRRLLARDVNMPLTEPRKVTFKRAVDRRPDLD
ncbi:MAG: hypothetical protein IPF66_24880 [Holophagales bacterium]|nr:hypothetical protein [Holophagales bacterium]